MGCLWVREEVGEAFRASDRYADIEKDNTRPAVSVWTSQQRMQLTFGRVQW